MPINNWPVTIECRFESVKVTITENLSIFVCFFLNHSNADALFVQSTRTQRFLKVSKPCHVGIHCNTAHSQVNTHMPGFRSYFRFFALFCIGKISYRLHRD